MAKRALIQLWYTEGSGPPPALEPGELAYSDTDQRLYVGRVDGSISALPTVVRWGDVQSKPTTMAQLGVTLQLSDIPVGIDYQTLQNRPDISALDELLDFPDLASFPVTGESGKLYINLATGLFYRWAAGQYHQLTGRAAIFGEIVGNPDDQPDLKAKFDALAAQVSALATEVENQKIKIGDLYFSTDASNPASKLGYGTWAAYAAGRAIVGVDANDSDFNTPGKTTGAKTHTLTEAQLPNHKHDIIGYSAGGASSIYAPSWVGSGSLGQGLSNVGIQPTGGGQAHNNMQPSIAVYIWRRTA